MLISPNPQCCAASDLSELCPDCARKAQSQGYYFNTDSEFEDDLDEDDDDYFEVNSSLDEDFDDDEDDDLPEHVINFDGKDGPSVIRRA